MAAKAVGYPFGARARATMEEVVAVPPRAKVCDRSGGAGGGEGAGGNAGGDAANCLDGEAKRKAEGNELLRIGEGGVLGGEGPQPVGSAVASAHLHASAHKRVNCNIRDDAFEPLLNQSTRES